MPEFNEDRSKFRMSGFKAYDKSSYKYKGGKWNASHLKKETNYLDDKKNPETLGPPKGKVGSEYRKREYDARGWKYDETIPGYHIDGSKKTELKPAVRNTVGKGGNRVEEAKKRAPHRYAGLSDDRIREILDKEHKRKSKKFKYKRGSSDLKVKD